MQKIPSIGFVSLGCAKNLVDTQRLSSALVAMGYRTQSDYSKCDVVIVNTCGFIDPAVEESLEAIGEALDYAPKVIVTGCLGTRADIILENYPQVAAVIGPGKRASVIRAIEKVAGVPPQSARQKIEPSGILLTPPHYAYLKIAEGCRHHCSFCIIPKLRGPLRSRTEENIFKEAEDLVARGVRELLVIAQDTSDYGFDLKERTTPSALCRKLGKLNRWIRLHYVYPSNEADSLVDLMGEGIVLPYLDVPLQHASPKILKSMKRPGNIEKTIRTIEKWRSVCPDLAIRSTFITGFPGETEEDFNELMEFIKEARLDRVGCFPYSDVDGADANSLPGSVPQEVREHRAQVLMETQARISYEKLESRVGHEYQMIVDYVSEEGQITGRSKYEAPDVDGIITVDEADSSIKPGDIITVKITSHDEHDMQATLVKKNDAALKFKGF